METHIKDANTNALLNNYELSLLRKNKRYLNKNKLKNESVKKYVNKNTAVNPHRLMQMSLDYEQIKPRDLIRSLNCKPDVEYSMNEIYPNIKPPISKCSPSQSSKWMAESLKDAGCGKFFSMEEDDVIEIWKSSPRKDTIGCYGVGSGIPGPDAVQFDITVGKCLEKVKQRAPRRSKSTSAVTMNAKKAARSFGPFILNRDLLSSTINRMPTVLEVMKASNTFNWQYCPQQPGSKPFIQSKARKDLNEERASQTKPCIKDRHRICGLMNAIPQNDCINYERLLKKKLDPSKVDKYEELEQMQRDLTMEPKNYDELYEQLVTCFERDPRKDSLSAAAKCCEKLFGDKNSTGGGGKGGDGGNKSGKGDGSDSGNGDGSGGKGAGGRGSKSGDGNDGGKGASKDSRKGEGKDGGKGDGIGGGKGGSRGGGKGEGKGEGKGGNKGEGKGGDGAGGKGGKFGDDQNKKGFGGDKDGMGGMGGTGGIGGKGGPGNLMGFDSSIGMGSGNETDKHSSQDILKDSGKREGSELRDSQLTKSSKQKKGTGGRLKGLMGFRKKKQQSKKDDNDCEEGEICRCEMCQFMNRRSVEEESPLIREMKLQNKRQQLRDYYKIMCHREYIKCRKPEYRSPQHKCDSIECDIFCNNPKLGTCCECLSAINQLMRLKGLEPNVLCRLKTLYEKTSRCFNECF